MRWAAFSPDGSLLATGPFHGFGVKVWDAHTGKLVKDLPVEEEGTTVAFTPDGRWLVGGTYTHYQFWEVGLWRPGLRIEGEGGVPAFSPDGTILAGSVNTKVRLHNARTGETLADLEPPTRWPIACLSFSPDGTKLAVCEGHSALRLWDLRAIRKQLAEMRLDWDLPPYPPKP
jgi:WD40 repeat protein